MSKYQKERETGTMSKYCTEFIFFFSVRLKNPALVHSERVKKFRSEWVKKFLSEWVKKLTLF